jgi:hAT family C-terminal dimerisation region
MKLMGKKKLEMRFAQFQFENHHFLPRRSKLDNYLEEPCVDIDEPNIDILQWWRKNSEFYPTLGKMARDFLTVQVSNVASESSFSAAGRLSNDMRS